MKQQVVKYAIYAVIIILMSVITISLVSDGQLPQIVDVLRKADLKIVILMMMMMMIIYILEGLILRVFARIYKGDYRWKQGTYNGLIGTFFSGLTPSATGGKFAQAYTFSTQGIPVHQSASILLMHFIAFQVSMIIFCFITLVTKFEQAYSLVKWGGFNVIQLSLIGFAINTVVIAGLYFLAYSRFLHRLITVHGINFLAKIKIVRKKERMRRRLELTIANFKVEATALHKNFRVMFTVLFLLIAKMFILYSIPFFAIRAIGHPIEATDFYLTVCFTSFVYLITSFIPIPGSSGGAEAMFQLFFSSIITGSSRAVIAAAMVLWRLVTFYFGMILGGLTFFFYKESGKKTMKDIPHPEKFYETVRLEKVQLVDGEPKVHFKVDDSTEKL